MDSYTFALALGGAGLVAMAAFGVAGSSGAAHSGGHGGHAGHTGAHSGGAHGANATGAHSNAHSIQSHGGGVSRLLAIASPRVIFSLLVGFGLVGIAARRLVPAPIALGIAIAGGIAFEAALVRPLWNALFRFASSPAATLESALLTEAKATSAFDATGHGLVAMEVDGQIVQCLGALVASDQALGVRVRSGDRLRVEEIDAERGRCTVSFVGHETTGEPQTH